jgi:hypothetical protein
MFVAMANWFGNRLTVSGNPRLLERMLEAVRGENGLVLDFERVRPTPTEEELNELGDDSGLGAQSGWYFWREAYWGPKWNLDEAEDELRLEGSAASGELTFFFDTADGVPVYLVEELSRQHLFLSFQLVYVEHGNDLAGVLGCSLGIRRAHAEESGEKAVQLLDRVGWTDQRDLMR